jgi:hypothetical protein
MSITIHPEIERLRRRMDELRLDLRLIIEEGFHLQQMIKPQILAKYDTLFGDKEKELQRKALLASMAQRRAELLIVRAERGQELTDDVLHTVEDMVRKEFEPHRVRITESFDMSSDERNKKANLNHTTEEQRGDNTELNRLYKSIVKKLHPDIHGETAEFQRFWGVVQSAYERKSIGDIRTLFNLLCVEERILNEVNPTTHDLYELEKDARYLADKVDYERRKLARLKTEEPFSMEKLINEEWWCNDQLNKIAIQIRKQERIIASAEEQISLLVGNRFDELKTLDVTIKERFDTQDDFFKNTYFSGRA